MKPKCTFLFLVFLLALTVSSKIFALDTTSTKFFPLKIGNNWIYYYFVRPAPPYPSYGYRYTATILRDTIISSHKFYLLSSGGMFTYSIFAPIWVRVDSVTGALITPSSCSSVGFDVLDSLSSSLHDTAYKCMRQEGRVCSNITALSIFGVQTQTKVFDATTMPAALTRKYSRNIGIPHTDYGELWYYSHDLLGCTIDGIFYGDTSLTGVINLTNELPQHYSLGQNYPNPFNPSTFIKFELPKSSFVSLQVFDLTGREVETLVSMTLGAGSYGTEFDASKIASGVYIYRLNAGDFTETKKMVLLK